MKLALLGVYQSSMSMAHTLIESAKKSPEPSIELCGIYSKDANISVNAAITLNCGVFLSLNDLFNEADIIFIGAGDSKLPQFPEVFKNNHVHDKILCHFSESYNSDILSCGTTNTYASIYMPYARKAAKLQNLTDECIMVEGFGKDFKKISKMLASLHDNVVICSESDKALAVLARRFSTDYVTELLSVSVQMCKFAGIYSPQKFYEHFIRTFIDNKSFKEGNICEYAENRQSVSTENLIRKDISLLNKINYSDFKSLYRIFEASMINKGKYTEEEKENLTLFLKRLR